MVNLANKLTSIKKRMLAVAGLCACAINMVVWLWVIDFTWCFTGNPTLYIPLFAWGVIVDKGTCMNLAYWNICLSFIFTSASAYYLGSEK